MMNFSRHSQRDRADESLASAVQIGRSFRQRIGFHPSILDRLRELLGVLHIPVVNDHFRLLLPILRLLDEPFGLLADPG